MDSRYYRSLVWLLFGSHLDRACLCAVGRRARIDGRVHAFAGQCNAVQAAHNAKELERGACGRERKTECKRSNEKEMRRTQRERDQTG